VLGKWLSKHITIKRNTVRFLLPKLGTLNLYQNPELLLLSRAVLKADEWKEVESEYRPLAKQYQDKLRAQLEGLFDRFAVLDEWSFSNPEDCVFHIEAHQARGSAILDAVQEMVRKSLFEPEEFEELVKQKAQRNESVDRLLSELQEPRAGGKPCIPWIGEAEIKDKLLRLCARGFIAINIRDMNTLTQLAGETEEQTWHRIKGQLGTGTYLKETYLSIPSPVPTTSQVNSKGVTQTSNPQMGGYTPTSGGAVQETGRTPQQPSGGYQVGESPIPTNLFGSSIATTRVSRYSTPATSSLNLMGKTESWGINSGSTIRNVTFKVERLTGAQLQRLLQNLPDGLAYELNLDKEE
jgi:hypothetical protein